MKVLSVMCHDFHFERISHSADVIKDVLSCPKQMNNILQFIIIV